jgi:hypothetical protein
MDTLSVQEEVIDDKGGCVGVADGPLRWRESLTRAAQVSVRTESPLFRHHLPDTDPLVLSRVLFYMSFLHCLLPFFRFPDPMMKQCRDEEIRGCGCIAFELAPKQKLTLGVLQIRYL